MKLVTFSGPPSSGKTSVLLITAEHLREKGLSFGVVKFDCLSTLDGELYENAGIPCTVGLSGNLCPDHFFISNIQSAVEWGESYQFDLMITESAGLCNRCSPHIKAIPAVCVIDCLSGINTPRKIGPMLKLADIVVVTKGEIVSQAEREVFMYKVRQASPKARVIQVNGITGQGSSDLARLLKDGADINGVSGKRLRFTMPAAMCSYCFGETRIGESCQTGSLKKMKFPGEGASL